MDTVVTPVVEIAQGKLSGLVKDGVLRFNGIPYAKAKRWQMPEAADAWSGIRDATRFGAVAPQIASASEAVLGGTPGVQDEDCLFLNVWTPACDNAKRAVMVWIHGGAFVTGAGSIGTYNGKYFAARGDVVVVTINYRLGAFGFLNMRDASNGKVAGNGSEGIADQFAALKWVKENIASFGGDPNNVTIFGESAGGMSCGALLGSPKARGLFHKAIPQSGAAHIGMSRESSAKLAEMVLSQLGVDAQTALTLPGKAILDAQAAVLANPSGGMLFGPTIDGDVLPKRPIEMVRDGNAKGVPVMTGSTRDEWRLFTLQVRGMADEKLAHMVKGLVGEDRVGAFLDLYREADARESWNKIMTDHTFMMPAVQLLETQSAHAPAYLYRFEWPSPMMKGALGACHALEIGFVFGTFNEKTAGQFFGTGPGAEALSTAMMDAWISFAKTGSPGADWPKYDAKTRQTMIFGNGAPHVESDPLSERRKLWASLPERMVGP